MDNAVLIADSTETLSRDILKCLEKLGGGENVSKSKVIMVSKNGGCDVDVVLMEKAWNKSTALGI